MTTARVLAQTTLLLALACAAESRADLVGHWTFDNTVANSKPIAGPVNGDGTISGGAVYSSVTSKVGGASLHFDGVDDFVNIGVIPVDHPLQLAQGQLSFAFWMLDETGTQNARIFDKATEGFARPGYGLWIESSSDNLSYRTGGPTGNNPNGLFRTAVNSIPSGVWRHVVYSIDGQTVRSFVDGVEQTMPTANNNPQPINAAAPLKFGVGGDVLGALGGAVAGAYFTGNLDDLGFWNEALTPGESIALYSVSESVLDYNQSAAERLFNVHHAAAGYATIGGLNWVYASGLSGANGSLNGSGGNYTLVLDATAGTGVKTVAVVNTPGDADGDGDIDENDFYHLNDRLFTSVSPGTHGDFNANGQPDFDDFGVWKSLFVAAGGSLDFLSVPEPASFTLALGFGVCLSIASRRR